MINHNVDTIYKMNEDAYFRSRRMLNMNVVNVALVQSLSKKGRVFDLKTYSRNVCDDN